MDEESSRRIVLPLRASGHGIPVFLVHSALGSTGYYSNLTRELPAGSPVYGINSVGLLGDATPLSSFPEMAAHYIAALRRVRPEGPYVIGGHSAGAYIAFEMCLQLGEQEAPCCIVIDQTSPEFAGIISQQLQTDVVELTIDLLTLIASLYGRPLTADAEEMRKTLKGNDSAGRRSHVGKWLKDLNFLPQNATDETAGAYMRVLMTNCVAATQWKPGGRQYVGRTAVIKVQDSLWGQSAYQTWQLHCTQPMDLSTVPGSHVSFLTKPHVRILAEAFQNIVDSTAGSMDA